MLYSLITIAFFVYRETSCDVTSPLSISFVNKIVENAFSFHRKQFQTAYHKKFLAVTQFRTGIDVCNVSFKRTVDVILLQFERRGIKIGKKKKKKNITNENERDSHP